MTFGRRTFLVGAAASTALAAPMLQAQARPRVVVIGGGAGGATAARHLARDSQGMLDVTLVDTNATYHTCFFSNLHLGGLRSYESLAHGYQGLAAAGVRLLHDLAVGVDRAARTVTLATGMILRWDRLVLSPGIDFDPASVPGWSLAAADIMPHAYKGGAQVGLLASQIQAMPQGGTFAMVAPPNPYRCPPAPYERVSMVAHLMTRSNPTAKILILDPKEKYAKQALFEEGWQAHYPGMITRIDPEMGGTAVEVRPDTMEVVIDGEVEKVDVCNVIPAQVAGGIAALAGLTDASGWAPVDPASMASRADPAVWVLGDASAQGDMPKSGSAANSQARVAAMAIRAELTDAHVPPAEYSSTCWSVIAPDDAVKVGATYAPTPERIASVDSFISQTGEDPALRKATYAESLDWYADITADIFG